MRGLPALLILLVLVLVVAARSHAQTPAAAPSESASTSPVDQLDTVRLKDGSLFRGTLLEHTPGVRSVLLLHDGTKREFEGAAIAEVVPASAPRAVAPAPVESLPPTAAPTAASPSLQLQVYTTRGYELSARRAGEHEHAPLCVNECTTPITPGTYYFRLGRPDGSGRWDAAPAFDISHDSRVEALLTDRRLTRALGGLILGSGVLTGSILLGRGIALHHDAPDDETKSAGRARIIAGTITALATVVVGVIMLTRRDQLNVKVVAAPR